MVSRRRSWQRLGGWCLLPLGLASCMVVAGTGTDAPALDARQWVARIQDAASNRNYKGTLIFSAGGAVTSSRVSHFCDGLQRYERVDMLDGQVRQLLRHNDQVQVVWPQARVAVLEPRDPVAAFPSLPGADLRVADAYELRVGGLERVAGHEAQVLLFKPRDQLRFAQRLWVERGTGLLLRADTLAAAGDVLESSAFSDLALGGKPQPDAVLGPMKKLDGYRVVRPAADRTQLEAEGWTLARGVFGFQSVGSVKRVLDATGAAPAAGATPVLQTVYSDGLTHVSVFVEPYDLQRHKPMRTATGATHTMTQRIDDWWVTVVGEVPMGTVEQFAAALKRRN
jgi:sigma-E factor negative regulatory protein RseB